MNQPWATSAIAIATAALGVLAGCAAPATVEKSDLDDIASAMRNFHADTGGWPNGNTAWYANQPSWRALPDTELDGESFTAFDTALFVKPPDIPACDAQHAGGYDNPCWKGPYLGSKSDSLGTAPWLDQWGRARMHAYVRPSDGLGGGIDRTDAAKGLIFIWSLGKDGIDGFACTDGSCAVDINAEAQGLPSNPKADDIVVEVATTA